MKKIPSKIMIVCCVYAVSFPILSANDQAAKNTHAEQAARIHTIIGLVAEVSSGNRLQLLLPDGSQAPLVLAGIKAPDKDSAIGLQSKKWLTEQIQGELVSADCERVEGERYCVVFPDNRDINLLSLFYGFSVFDKSKASIANESLYRSAERYAREIKRGIWHTRT